MDLFIQLLLTGVALGSGYALGGLGFVLIYKATGVFNFSHGQLTMVGAYFFYMFQVQLGLPPWWSVPAAVASMFLVGVMVERLCLRRMVGESAIAIIMLTIGLGTLLRNLVGLVWGTQPQSPVPLFKAGFVDVLGARVPSVYLWTLLTAAVFIGGFVLYFRRSSQGIAMRAVAFHQDHAALSGISIHRVFAYSWGLAGMMAAISGIMMVQLVGLDLSMDARGLSAFPAAILGGIDSIGGVIIGGLIIGLVESFAGGYLDPVLGGGVKEVIGYVVLLLILMIRPYGLFGTPEIKKV
ncbi:branched-chain amino acid ABC transporter permease [Lacisediminimonas profundi]|uniref:branched-chain amino acid ABC transporter permease n=1 Tax=Lacisediminimonas profundi TaxID=2603856 RepID=UPI00124BC018|nr:branched-chain amino acid ABC transporter permease [Lacisediminimonas profundi]